MVRSAPYRRLRTRKRDLRRGLDDCGPSRDNRAMHALSFHAGPTALAHIRAHGLRARDVAVVPAAAGGPKGLIFQALDLGLPKDGM